MKIAIGCDHSALSHKKLIMDTFGTQYDFTDMGTYTEDAVDYPDIAFKVGEAVAAGDYDFGILICGTGIGMCISANKVQGIRAAVVSDTYSARLTREHNDTNILCFGQRVVGPGLAVDIVKSFLEGEYQGGRHQKRVDKINQYQGKA